MMYSSGGDDSSLSGCDSVMSGVYTTDGYSLSTSGRNNARGADFRARVASEDERIAQEFNLPIMVIPRPYSINHSSTAGATTGDTDCIKAEKSLIGAQTFSKVDKKVKVEASDKAASGTTTRNSKSEPGRGMTTLTDVQDQEEAVSESAGVSKNIPSRREDATRDEEDVAPVPDTCLASDVDIETDHDASEDEDNYEREDDYDDVLSVIMPPECNVAFPDILGKKKQDMERGPKVFKKRDVEAQSGIYYPPSYPKTVAQQLPSAIPPPAPAPPAAENPESLSTSLGNSLSMLPLSAKSIFAGAYDSLVQTIRTKNLSQDAVGEGMTAAAAEVEVEAGAAMHADAQSIMTWDHQSGLDLDRKDVRGTFPPLSGGSNSGGSLVCKSCKSVSSVRKLWGCRVNRLIIISTAVLLIALGLAVGAKIASNRAEEGSINGNLNEAGSPTQPQVPTPSITPPMIEFPTMGEPVISNPVHSPTPPSPGDPIDSPSESRNSPTGTPLFQDPGDSDIDDKEQPTLVDAPSPTTPMMAPTARLIPVTFAPRVTNAPAPSPTTAPQTQQTPPTGSSTVVDCEDSTGAIFVNSISRTCAWLASTSSGFKNYWCGSQQALWDACPETCGACNAAPIQPQVSSPTSSPSASLAFPEEPVFTEPPANSDDDTVIVNQTDVRQAILKAAPSSTTLALDDSSSPQSEALAWLEESFLQDEQNVGLPSWRLQQRFALATFAATASNEHDRRLEKSMLDWMESEDECMWTGITCDGSGKIIAITITKDDNSGSDIGGSLPPEWAMLNSLQLIDLQGIGLTGAIPSEFGKLYRLQTLRLAENNMSGSISSDLSGMVSLKELSLHSNQFSGDFPSDAISQLVSLDFLTLHRTELTGDLSPICERNRQFISLIITCSALEGDCYTLCYAQGTE